MQTHGVIIKVAIMSLLVSGLGVTGCTGNIERSDFASIKVGATRQTIESLLGKPVKSVETYAGTTDTHRYNIVRSGSESDTSGAEIAVAMLNPHFTFFGHFYLSALEIESVLQTDTKSREEKST